MRLFEKCSVRGAFLVLAPILIGILATRQLAQVPEYLPLQNQSIHTLQEFLRNGSLTSEQLVQVYLDRIEESTPTFHAVAEINPRALEIARELDIERREFGSRGPLHGLPVLVKDSISAHGMNNTAGSLCLVGAKTREEASVITRLQKAGAIILGKANMSQWGNARSSSKTQSNGWSAWGGQTIGAFHPNQDPCGSSSGSGVAMALDLATFTVGVGTLGSIICPAGRNNVVAIQPTSGLIAKDNIIINKRRGSVGPYAKTVRDAAVALDFMVKKSPDESSISKYEESCELADLSSARLAVPRNAFDNPFVRNMNLSAINPRFEEVITLFRLRGAKVLDNANYSSYDLINRATAPQTYVAPAEYKKDIADYFSGLETNPFNLKSVEDMISCTKSTPEEDYPSRDVSFFEIAQDASDTLSEDVVEGIKEIDYLGGTAGIDGVLDITGADAIMLPSIVGADVPGLVGYPIITVPMGFSPPDMPVVHNERGNLVWDGPDIPYGLSFIGRAYSEAKLIQLAYTFEQLTQSASERRPFKSLKKDINRPLSWL